MPHTPDPIFKDALGRIEWKKIYEREYGVQYSEMALLCLASKAGYHIPSPSVNQIVIPEGNNTAFYIAVSSWEALVDSLNQAYTGHIDKLKTYEKDFVKDGEAYLAVTNKIAGLDLAALSNQELLRLYREYQARLFRYSIFAWTSFILNNYVAERASAILDSYLARQGMKAQKQDILDALFKPQKKAAVLCLQDEIAKYGGKLLDEQFETLFEKYKWLSCLDIHNDPWTRDDLLEMLLASNKRTELPARLFSEYSRQLQISETDLGYLHMAQRFVYIKDARDDYRRQGVYKALPFFEEMAKRMGLDRKQFGYLLEAEVSGFLAGDLTIDVQIVQQRRKAFILYLDPQESPVCLQGDAIAPALVLFGLEKAG